MRLGHAKLSKLLLHGARLFVSLKFASLYSKTKICPTMLYPIGIQNFENIRQGNYLYVDKTDLIYRLATTGKYYFLSRPRRFGKSLLVSTMEAYFHGKKELFKGLAIEKLEKDWTDYPVLHLDLSGVTYTDENVLNEKMESTLRLWEKAYDVANDFKSDSVRFYNIIDAAYEKTGKPVAILIDEYDKPLLDSTGNEPLREAFRSRLQGFYSVMRSPNSASSASSAASTTSTTSPWIGSSPASAASRSPNSMPISTRKWLPWRRPTD